MPTLFDIVAAALLIVSCTGLYFMVRAWLTAQRMTKFLRTSKPLAHKPSYLPPVEYAPDAQWGTLLQQFGTNQGTMLSMEEFETLRKQIP